MRIFLLVIQLGFVLAPVTLVAADDPLPSATETESPLLRSVRQEEEIARYESSIAELESSFGPFDASLLEPLGGLADRLVESGDYEGAASLLERRLQLIRTVEGPQSLSQLAVVDEIIRNDIRRQDWDDITGRFEYIYWLRSQDPAAGPEVLLGARDDVIKWLFASVYLGEPTRRVRNFQTARSLSRENLQLAEEIYSSTGAGLVPWLYRHAVLQHRLYAFLEAEDELGYWAREEILQIEARTRESYLREGLNTVKRITDILVAEGDLEGAAMGALYEADFQMLLELGTAARRYRDAMGMYQDAGIDQQRIDDLFLRPAVIPVPEFHGTLAAELAFQESLGLTLGSQSDPKQKSIDLGTFTAWDESLPFAARPPVPDTAVAVLEAYQLNELEMEFSLNSRGKTRNPEILRSEPEGARLGRKAREAVKAMQFRPRFIDGRWQRVEDARIRYLVPPQR